MAPPPIPCMARLDTIQKQIFNDLLDIYMDQNSNYWHGPKPQEGDSIVCAPRACKVAKVLVEEGMQLQIGDPVFLLNIPRLIKPSFPLSEEKKTQIKAFLDKHSGFSNYSIQDVVLPELHDPPAAATNDQDDDFLKTFNKFDTVVDHSDHLYSAPMNHHPNLLWGHQIHQGNRILLDGLLRSTMTSCIPFFQPPNHSSEKIHQDCEILKQCLPETIFVRAYQDRKDLLRAVIIGPEGTPFHDALFFFDVCFPSNYPDSPPLVCSHSFVLGVNPNLNNGSEDQVFRMYTTAALEKTWVPGTSNVLQYLLSIQGLILNTRPLFNALPLLPDTSTSSGPSASLLYNENILIKSLETMVCTMAKPPKHFEDFVAGHFRKRARDILMSCKSYMEGLQAGCLVSSKNQTCSTKFKKDVSACVKLLAKAFHKIGAKEVESFLHMIEMDVPQPPSYAPATPDAAGVDMNVEVKQKRKDIGRTYYPSSLTSFSDFTLAKVLVEEGEEVERGQPLYIMGQRKPYVWDPSISSRAQTLYELKIKKTLRRNWVSRVGIFSMEDVFVDQNHSHQMEGLDNEEDVQKMYQNFNKFDTVLDHTDHFFSSESSAMNQQKEWVDKIREEWRILAEYLPETIYVRVYEDRMDLLRAVIVGPRETPYHNGLFFFDVCFPSDYPDSPPLVHYRSGGLGINPNMYKCGKVLLSLPKTSCGQETMWVRGSSTMLQLLVSIQDRILNAKPLFNDLAYSVLSGSVYGEESSVLYNRNTFIKTLKTMVYTMKSLPKNFEVFAVGHFCNHFGDILAACDKEAKKTSSVTFKNDLNACIQQLSAAFNIIEPKKLPSS